MPHFIQSQEFQQLDKSKNIFTRFSFQMTYGLIVIASECGRIYVQLASGLPEYGWPPVTHYGVRQRIFEINSNKLEVWPS